NIGGGVGRLGGIAVDAEAVFVAAGSDDVGAFVHSARFLDERLRLPAVPVAHHLDAAVRRRAMAEGDETALRNRRQQRTRRSEGAYEVPAHAGAGEKLVAPISAAGATGVGVEELVVREQLQPWQRTR